MSEFNGLLAQISAPAPTIINFSAPPISAQEVQAIHDFMVSNGGQFQDMWVSVDGHVGLHEIGTDEIEAVNDIRLSVVEREIGRQLHFWQQERWAVEDTLERLGRRKPSAKTTARHETAKRQHDALRLVWRNIVREKWGYPLQEAL